MNKNSDTKVVVAMSGGVDSSVSAALLKEAGFNVVGVFMKCWNADDFAAGECTAEEDEYWARRAAAHLGIPFYSFDLVTEYKKRVVDYFIREYAAGRTPNPDIMCNQEIKFGAFFDKAVGELGADYIATGHYARISKDYKLQATNYKLLKGTDPNKDQTYFLYRVPQDKLARTIFPIGEYPKPQVRELARKFGLPNAEKKDSQGLCFIGKVDVGEFIKHYIPKQKGAVVTTGGETIGTHEGLHLYTIGQRHGIGIGGGVPYYVVEKNTKTNTLIVGTNYDDGLFRGRIEFSDPHWITGTPVLPLRCQASIRYRQEPQDATLNKTDGGNFMLTFTEPQRAAASGQSVVLYGGAEVLGGGVII